MPESQRLQLVRDVYSAFDTRDRTILDAALTEDFVFYSRAFPEGLPRAEFFEQNWEKTARLTDFTYPYLEEISGDGVLAIYEATRADGSRYRSGEIFVFAGEQICRAEVYFGWDLPNDQGVRES